MKVGLTREIIDRIDCEKGLYFKSNYRNIEALKTKNAIIYEQCQ